MSIIARLLAGNVDEAADLSAVRTLLGGSNKPGRRETQRFARAAKQSDIGGVGTGFNDMTGAQQAQFIGTSRSKQANILKQAHGPRPGSSAALKRDYGGGVEPGTYSGVSPDAYSGAAPYGRVGDYNDPTKPIVRQPEPAPPVRRTGSEQLSPEEKMARADRLRNERDASPEYQGYQGYQGSTPPPRDERGYGQILMDDIDSFAAELGNPNTGVQGMVGRAALATPDIIKRAVNNANDIAADMGDPTTGIEGMVGRAVLAAPDAIKNAGAAIKQGAGDAVDAVTNNPIMRMFAGDTSGAAAANAGQTFNKAHEAVFGSKATAEAFGLEDASPLQAAFGKTGDDFSAPLQKAGLDSDQIAGLQKFQDEVAKVKGEGGQLSEEGMQSMLKNQGEIGNMYGGFSRAGATASPNALLRGMAGEGTGMESVMGIAAVAGLAGGANVAMGGDFTEGAAVGGIGALSVRGIAKGVAGSMGDIEQSMMKSILGDDMATKTVAAKPAVMQGEALSRIPASRLQDDTLGELTGNPLIPNAKVKLSDATPDQKSGLAYMGQELEREAAINARRQNLTAIQKMGDDDERLQGFGKKKMRDMLNPNKEKNVAMNNRALVLGGGMLSGVAFTGNADRRDYRRGFNAHRGNRI